MKQEFVSVTTYAKLCKCQRQTIYDRIETGKIKAEQKPGIGTIIDIIKYPPIKAKKTGRPTIEEKLKRLNE